jgi:hypothetical protein
VAVQALPWALGVINDFNDLADLRYGFLPISPLGS